jgi:hypothetical protein
MNVLCTDGKEISRSSDIDDLKRRITEAVAAVTSDECGKSWIIDLTSATSHITRGAHIE